MSSLRLSRWFRTGALTLLSLSATSSLSAQLTPSGNQTFREDDFDALSFDALNHFGSAVVTCDFDGDGFTDLAIGAPFQDLLGLVSNSGVVHVAYGSTEGLTLSGHQTLTQPPSGLDPPEENDNFGRSLGAGDFDDDGHCDLAVGSPGETISGAVSAGVVHVFAGGESGLSDAPRVFNQNTAGLPSVPEAADRFGGALAAGRFDGDTFSDLAIGVPGENSDAGAVQVLFGSTDGLSSSGSEFLFQGDPAGMDDDAEPGDRFGATLATAQIRPGGPDELVVGVPGESAPLVRSGMVHVLYPDAEGFEDREADTLTQSWLLETSELDDQFGTAIAAGDFDGDGDDDLAIATPTEDVGPDGSEVVNAGTVGTLYSDGFVLQPGDQVFTQESPGISDQVETGDQLGRGLAAGDFDGDGRDDLAIGVPFEDFEGGGHVNNGAVHILYGSHLGLATAGEQYHGQGAWNVGAVDDNDGFGSVLTSGDFDDDGVEDLAVGIPGEDVDGENDAGLVAVITGSNHRIFVDGFESGSTIAWGPPPP